MNWQSLSAPLCYRNHWLWRARLLFSGILCTFVATSLAVAADKGVAATPVSAYLAGAAVKEITPPLGGYLAGYDRDRRSTGVLDPIYAKALVVDDGASRLVFVTLDTIGLTRPDVLRIRQGVHERLPVIPLEQIVVSSTHTHAGPDVVGLWGEALWRSGRDPGYVDALIERAVTAVVEANEKREPVDVRVASRSSQFSWVENRSEPELLDHVLTVMQFSRKDGTSLGSLTNFACHPTVLDGTNTHVSSDYVSSFYQSMNDTLGGDNLFLQGAIGGWVQPITDTSPRQDQLRAIGTSVAEQAVLALADARIVPVQPLQARQLVFDIPIENWGFRLLMWLGVLERESFAGAMRTEAAWLQIGDVQFVTHPGETSPEFSLQSRQLMSSQDSFVLGLSQDAIGYILKADYFLEESSYPHGSYLRSVSVGPEAGPRLMGALRQLIPAVAEPNADNRVR